MTSVHITEFALTCVHKVLAGKPTAFCMLMFKHPSFCNKMV